MRERRVHFAWRDAKRSLCGQAPTGQIDWRGVTCRSCLRQKAKLTAPPTDAVDIGGGHAVSFLSYDRERHPEAPDPAGLIDWHLKPSGVRCGGGVYWWRPPGEEGPVWTLVSLDPLHLEPSILCVPDKGGCGSHGWIRGGRWQEA